MSNHTVYYAKTDVDDNLVVPIEVVNVACKKEAGLRCLDKNDNVDEEYYAKKIFG